MSHLALSALLVFLAACTAIDVRARRIPNGLTAAAMLGGLAVSTGDLGTRGFGASLAGVVAGALPLLVPFARGGVGGGDVKMMAAVGAFVGPALVLASVLFGMILGGVVMSAHLCRRGRLREKLLDAAVLLTARRLPRGSTDCEALALPYSIPLALGTLVAVALSGVVGVAR